MNWLLVALGSLAGGAVRALLSLILPSLSLAGTELPWATLAVNISGAFAIGLYAALRGPGAAQPASAAEQQFMMAGVCGGYTTFSIFSVESLALLASGHTLLTALWVGLSVASWLLATWLGLLAGERYNAPPAAHAGNPRHVRCQSRHQS